MAPMERARNKNPPSRKRGYSQITPRQNKEGKRVTQKKERGGKATSGRTRGKPRK